MWKAIRKARKSRKKNPNGVINGVFERMVTGCSLFFTTTKSCSLPRRSATAGMFAADGNELEVTIKFGRQSDLRLPQPFCSSGRNLLDCRLGLNNSLITFLNWKKMDRLEIFV